MGRSGGSSGIQKNSSNMWLNSQQICFSRGKNYKYFATPCPGQTTTIRRSPGLFKKKKNSCAVLGCVLTGGASRRSTPRLWLPAPRSQLPTTQPIFGTVEERKINNTQQRTQQPHNARTTGSMTRTNKFTERTENRSLHPRSPTPHLSGRLGVVRHIRTSCSLKDLNPIFKIFQKHIGRIFRLPGTRFPQFS